MLTDFFVCFLLHPSISSLFFVSDLGFDLELVELISSGVNIPVIASSGAGCSQHFVDVFQRTNASAALAAGIFHREEVKISTIKEHMIQESIPTRSEAADFK